MATSFDSWGSLRFGFSVPNLPMDVANLGYGIDGVLGMNFLSDFNFEIRTAEQRILVEQIAP